MRKNSNKPKATCTEALRIKAWIAGIQKEYAKSGMTAPKSKSELTAFTRWLSNCLSSCEQNGGKAQNLAYDIEVATVKSWIDGERMPRNYIDALSNCFGDQKMDILWSEKTTSPLGLILKAVDAFDVKASIEFINRYPAAADIFGNDDARFEMIKGLRKFSYIRSGACREVLSTSWEIWDLGRTVCILDDPSPWMKAIFNCDLALSGWNPLMPRNQSSIVIDLENEDRSVLNRADVPLKLSEYACWIIAKDIEPPEALYQSFIASILAHAGLRYNAVGEQPLGRGVTLDQKIVDLALDVLLFMNDFGSGDVEYRMGQYFCGCEAYEWVEWLSRFLIGAREYLEDLFREHGLNHRDLLVIMASAERVYWIEKDDALGWIGWENIFHEVCET